MKKVLLLELTGGTHLGNLLGGVVYNDPLHLPPHIFYFPTINLLGLSLGIGLCISIFVYGVKF